MNLYAKLRERDAQGKPLRVGLVGAGKFGAMYLAQVPKTPGLHLAGIADLSPPNAKANLQRVGWTRRFRPSLRMSARIGRRSFRIR
jgi:predicted homoserine dehydrogenase-like protein